MNTQTIDIEKNKEIALKTLRANVTRDGIEDLIQWLESSDFFTAPASTRFHLAFDGGLCLHSIHVLDRLMEEMGCQYNGIANAPYSKETITLVALCHDLCKIGFYKKDTRNVKNEAGKWEQVPYFKVEEQFAYGHGEKSAFLLNGFMKLSFEEAQAIRFHMGGFDEAVKGGSYSCGHAFEANPLAILLHIADIKASYLDERSKG